ncbi:MAG: glycosyltransferase family 61 protein [Fuerstiella sp.]
MSPVHSIKSTAKKFLRRVGAKPPICEDIAAWARAREISALDVSPPVHDEFFPISQEDNAAKQVLDYHLAEYQRPQSLVVLKETRVRDEVGFVFLSDGSVCEQGTWFRPYLVEHRAYYAYFRQKQLIGGDVFSLLGVFSEGFFHWFHDTLPRLLVALPHLPKGVRFLIHHQPRDYQLDSLLALGITQESLVYQQEKIDSVCERLWFITPHGNAVFGGGATLRDLACRIRRANTVPPRVSDKRIYISRSKASRSVVNETAILPILQEHGFELVHMEDLAFSEQVKLCASVKIMIGAHGAGLTNLLYCDQGVTIGEIANIDVFPFYLGMARQLGHQYMRFTANKSIDEKLEVDVDEFEKWLAQVVSNSL